MVEVRPFGVARDLGLLPRGQPRIGIAQQPVGLDLNLRDLGIDVDAVSVKATTTEMLGFTGRGEGIAAQAVCLLVRA